MSNQLLNKLKMIDNSRQRLKNILADKNILASNNSLPGLVEMVSDLYPKDYTSIGWDGVPEEAEPDHYITPVDFNDIYNSDTDKDDYPNVAMYIISVNDGDISTLRAGVLNGFQYYKYSDTKTLVSASNYNNTVHTWDETKDVIANGKKYRWVMCYGNTTNRSLDYEANYVNLEAMIVFKGTYNSIGWRGNSSAPKYTEIMEGCILNDNGSNLDQGGITSSDNGYECPSPETFICNAQRAYLTDGLFQNCRNLKFVKITSERVTAENRHNYTFAGCYSLRYVYFRKVAGFDEYTFRYVHDCYVQVDESNGNYFARPSNYIGPFSQSDGIRLRVGSMNNTGKFATERDGIAFAKNMEIEIGDIHNDIYSNAFNQYLINAIGIKITGTIYGGVNENSFLNAPIYGRITFGNTSSDKSIKGSSFAGCTVSQIDMSNSNITTIDNNAFERCLYLSSVILGNKLTTLGSYLFLDCMNLKSIVIPDSVSAISPDTFRESRIENITMGRGITTLPDNLFRHTSTLQNVTLADNLVNLGIYCFAFCGKLKSLVVPESVTKIPNYCFYESGIEELTFLGKIKTIGESSFDNCTNLKNIDISELETCGANAFRGAHIQNLVIPKTLITYATTSFEYIPELVIFENGFVPNTDIILAGTDINNDTILDVLFSLPDISESTNRTLTISPTKYNGIRAIGYTYYDGIKNRKIAITEDGLSWDDSGTTTVNEYVTAKNWNIV